MCRLVFVLLLLLSLCADSFAQAEENGFRHHLGIKSGWTGFRFRDRVISTYLYTGSTIPLELEYGYSNAKFRSSASFLFNANDSVNTRASILNGFAYKGEDNTFVQDTIGYLNHQTVQLNYLNFNFDVLRKLEFLHSQQWQFFLGGGFNFISTNKKFLSLFYTNQLSNRFYSIQMVGRIEFTPSSKNIFSYQISLPIFNRIHRVLHLEDAANPTNSYKKWSFYSQYISVYSNLSYRFRFSKHWSLEGLYQFGYIQCTFPRKEQMVVQSITAGINFHF